MTEGYLRNKDVLTFFPLDIYISLLELRSALLYSQGLKSLSKLLANRWFKGFGLGVPHFGTVYSKIQYKQTEI